MSPKPRPLRLRTLLATLVLASGLLLAMLGRPAPAEAQVSAMLPDQLKNLTYPGVVLGQSVQLHDGKYVSPEAIGPGQTHTTVRYVTSSTSEDLSAVILAMSGGGSGTFFTLHLVHAQNGVATAGIGLDLGDNVQIEGIARSEEGCIVISLVTHNPSDAHCCPTKRETREYIADGNLFRLVLVDGISPAQAQTPVVPRTGNLGPHGTSATTALLAILAAAILPLASRRLVRTEAQRVRA